MLDLGPFVVSSWSKCVFSCVVILLCVAMMEENSNGRCLLSSIDCLDSE